MLRQLILFVVILNVCSSYDDYFTALSQLEPLLDTQKRVVEDLNIYIRREEERLYILKWNLDIINHEQEKAARYILNYLGNPINAFKLIKKLTTGLDVIEDSIKRGSKYAKSVTLRHKHLNYPCLDDLKGATLGLNRLQETYHLKIHEVSQGILNGINCNSSFSSDDCYEIGRVLYYAGDLEHSHAWMLEAYKKYDAMDELFRKTMPFTNVSILDYIENLVAKTNQENTFSNGIKTRLFEEELNNTKENQMGKSIMRRNLWKVTNKSKREKRIYESLCQGETTIHPNITNRLKCWLSSRYHTFLKYSPIKIEQIYIKPNIYKFYDFLSDFEIEHIISKAKPKLLRSAVDQHYSAGQSRPSNLRISKSAALSDEESPILAGISKRINEITGLDMQYAETFQVANYGIGGYYAPHYDFARPGSLMGKVFKKSKGNRIATILLYLSNVAQGGATIFTKLGLSILPTKRMAVYWLNLHSSGDCDRSTIHAACPVLRGSKWVGTKWIHEAGQELNRPCPMEYLDYQSKTYYHLKHEPGPK